MADKAVVLDLDVRDGACAFPSSIEDALKEADAQRIQLDEQLSETLDTIKALTPECDKLDYILSDGLLSAVQLCSCAFIMNWFV